MKEESKELKNYSVERQLFRITAEKSIKDYLWDKTTDYKDGFYDGCEWLNEYTRGLLGIHFGKD